MLFTDDDCTVEPSWVAAGVGALGRDPPAIVTGRVLAPDDAGHVPSTIDDPSRASTPARRGWTRSTGATWRRRLSAWPRRGIRRAARRSPLPTTTCAGAGFGPEGGSGSSRNGVSASTIGAGPDELDGRTSGTRAAREPYTASTSGCGDRYMLRFLGRDFAYVGRARSTALRGGGVRVGPLGEGDHARAACVAWPRGGGPRSRASAKRRRPREHP